MEAIGSVRPSSLVHTAITRGSRLTITCKPLCLSHKRGRAGTRSSHTTTIDECLNRKDPGQYGLHPTRFQEMGCHVGMQRVEMRSGLKLYATTQSLVDGFSSISVNQIQLSKKRKFVAEIVFHAKIELSIKRRARPLERAAPVMARKFEETTRLKSVLGCSYVA